MCFYKLFKTDFFFQHSALCLVFMSINAKFFVELRNVEILLDKFIENLIILGGVFFDLNSFGSLLTLVSARTSDNQTSNKIDARVLRAQRIATTLKTEWRAMFDSDLNADEITTTTTTRTQSSTINSSISNQSISIDIESTSIIDNNKIGKKRKKIDTPLLDDTEDTGIVLVKSKKSKKRKKKNKESLDDIFALLD